MANRRMLTLEIVNSDAFLEMPISAQALYFHLCMRADDDGFCSSPVMIQRSICAKPNDLKILLEKKFLLQANNGVLIIKHWWMHNTMRKDTFKHSRYLKDNPELRQDSNKAYTFDKSCVRYLIDNEENKTVINSVTEINKCGNEPLTETQRAVNENTTERQRKNNEPLTQSKSNQIKINKTNLKENNSSQSNSIKENLIKESNDDDLIEKINKYLLEFKKTTPYSNTYVDSIAVKIISYIEHHEITNPLNYFIAAFEKKINGDKPIKKYENDDAPIPYREDLEDNE